MTQTTTSAGTPTSHPLAKSWTLASLILGLLFYGIFFYSLNLLHNAGVKDRTFLFLHERLLERGWIPHIMTVGLMTGLALLLLRLPMLNREFRHLGYWRHTLHETDQLYPQDLDTMMKQADEQQGVGALGPSMVRVYLEQLLTRARTALNGTEVDAIIDQIGTMERRKIDASHVPVRYLIWLIPTLGFLGTVLGISMAVSGFSEVITRSQGMSDMQSHLVEICRELGVAFDTTFVALIYSSLIALMMAYVDRRELTLVNMTDELCASVLRPKLGHIIGYDAEATSPASPSERMAAPAADEARMVFNASARGGRSAGPLVVLQAPAPAGDGERTDVSLHDVAAQVVSQSLSSLASSGENVAQALAQSGVALQLQRMIEANLVHMHQQCEWMNTSALRREDIQALVARSQEQNQRFESILNSLVEQTANSTRAVQEVRELLARLDKEGVRANVSISSVVSPA